ncbi:MAG: ATP12 family protein [Sulfitobacter sp.]
MSEWKAKRFWKIADVVQAEDGFSVALDGRAVKTPAKNLLVMPTRAMAQAVTDEWQAQEEQINPATMPVTRTANAAIDKVIPQHGEVAELLAAYGDSDLLCYRAESPAELVSLQIAQWDPLLDWAELALGARLLTRVGIMHKPQSPAVLERLGARVHALTAFELAAFHDLVSLSGSLVIAFAATLDERPADRLWQISRLDENFQAELWGRDDEAEAMAALKKASFLHAKRMFDLAKAL